jgi:hypothetical protein
MQIAAIPLNPHESEGTFRRAGNRCLTFGLCIGLMIALLVLTDGCIAGRAQLPSSNPGSTSAGQGMGQDSSRGGFGRSGASPLSSGDDYDPVMMERRMRMLNAERQKQMVADTNKLFKLARELNDEVAKANESSFTLDQLRKIAEIEKLAKSVRERMAAGSGETPNLFPPPALVYPVH